VAQEAKTGQESRASRGRRHNNWVLLLLHTFHSPPHSLPIPIPISFLITSNHIIERNATHWRWKGGNELNAMGRLGGKGASERLIIFCTFVVGQMRIELNWIDPNRIEKKSFENCAVELR